jgi:NAD(P)-dependent dehydrogenase (short-subunit alcohol dehydrogenase family)
MNPVGEQGNMFAALFDKMPARRAGRAEDIAGTVLYLCSQAGVSVLNRLHVLLLICIGLH